MSSSSSAFDNNENEADLETDNTILSEEGISAAEDSSECINLTVLNNAGKTILINFNANEIVETLQTKIQEKCGISKDKQCFTCFESTESNKEIKETSVDNNSKIGDNVEAQNDAAQNVDAEYIQMTVLNNAQKMVSIKVNVKEPIKNLQAKIQNECEISSSNQRFTCLAESSDTIAFDIWQELSTGIAKLQTQHDLDQQLLNQLQTQHDEDQKRIAELQIRHGVNQQLINQLQAQHDVDQQTITRLKFFAVYPPCTLEDVVVNGKIDYERLNEKTLLVEKLKCVHEEWLVDGIEISFEHCDFQIYLQKVLHIYAHQRTHPSFIFDRFICKNLEELFLFEERNLKYADYKKLTSSKSLRYLDLRYGTVIEENGNVVEIDKLLEEIENIEVFYYGFNKDEVTPETAQKLAALSPFSNLQNIILLNVQSAFDLEAFGEFIRKNPTIVDCELNFAEISVEFSQKMERIKENLLPTLPSTCRLFLKY